MKRFITSLFIILSASCYTFAQITYMSNRTPQRAAKIIDASVMQAVYKASSIRDSLATDRVAIDTMILQIGNNRISKYFPDTRVRDSIMRATFERQMAAAQTSGGGVTIRAVGTIGSGGQVSSGDQTIVFKNWPAGNITVTDRVVMDSYSYTESSNEMLWQILPDTETILSYSCQKAVTTFRGRDYEAWFTPDIPINEGPWKFCGLPGLILKVSDTRQHYVFECIGLEQREASIEYADMDYLKTNRKDLAKIKRKYFEDPMAAMENMTAAAPGGANVRIIARTPDGTTMDVNQMRANMSNRAYNPIELDY